MAKKKRVTKAKVRTASNNWQINFKPNGGATVTADSLRVTESGVLVFMVNNLVTYAYPADAWKNLFKV